jgi:hypothetical protein
VGLLLELQCEMLYLNLETFSADEFLFDKERTCLLARARNMTCRAENMVDETHV